MSGDIVERIIMYLESERNKADRYIEKCNKEIEKFKKKLNRVTVKKGKNVYMVLTMMM